MSEFHSTRAADAVPQTAGDVSDECLAAFQAIQGHLNTEPALVYQIASRMINRLVLSSHPPPAPPFSQWADIIKSASLAISPKGSEALNALAAEVQAYDVSKL